MNGSELSLRDFDWRMIGLAWLVTPVTYLLTADITFALLGTAGMLTVVAVGEQQRYLHTDSD